MLLWVFSEDQQLAANLWLLWSVLPRPSRSHLNDVTGWEYQAAVTRNWEYQKGKNSLYQVAPVFFN